MYVLGLALALAVGLSLGMLGGGGSSLTLPILHYVFGVGAHDAIAMSLVVVGVTSAVAVIPHARAGNVRWRVGLAFGIASMAGAFAGAKVSPLLPGVALIAAFAVVMVVAGVVMLVRASRPLHCHGELRTGRIVAIGAGVGLLTGTLGAGGGFVIVPVLTLFGGLAIREAVATSLLVIAFNSTAGVAGALGHATFNVGLVALVTAIAVAGSVLGASVVPRIPARNLMTAFAWFVIAIGLFMLVHELAH